MPLYNESFLTESTDMLRRHYEREVGTSSTRATGYILCAEKSGLKLFYQFRPQGFLKMADDSLRDVCFEVLCQSMPIDERILCGYRLIIN